MFRDQYGYVAYVVHEADGDERFEVNPGFDARARAIEVAQPDGSNGVIGAIDSLGTEETIVL